MNYLFPKVPASDWVMTFDDYNPADEKRREIIFASGNGITITRASSVDASIDKYHSPGTYRAGCYDGLINKVNGGIDITSSLANLPNWLSFTFRIGDGKWFKLDETSLLSYQQGLNLQDGITWRNWVCMDEDGHRSRVHERRFVSMANPFLSALRVEITPINWSGQLQLRSGIQGNAEKRKLETDEDYKNKQHESKYLEVVETNCDFEHEAALISRLRMAGVEIAQIVRTYIEGCEELGCTKHENPDSNEVINTIECTVERGNPITITKLASMFTSEDRISHTPVTEARNALNQTVVYDVMEHFHKCAWQTLWQKLEFNADDKDFLRAMRFNAYHVMQTVSPHTAMLDIGIPARGWQGEAYHGHIFWDELFVFPFLNSHFPDLARSILMYRYRRLNQARKNAREAGYRGAMFPSRSARSGQEVAPHYERNLLSEHWHQNTNSLEHHIGSTIVFNIWQYYLATGDQAFLDLYGAETILEICRFWASIARLNEDTERYEIRSVVGPDEYHQYYPERKQVGINNNAYTNLMAVWSLCRGLEVLDLVSSSRKIELIEKLRLHSAEFHLWEEISRKMHIAFHDKVISQFEGFEHLQHFSPGIIPEKFKGQRIDWALEAIGDDVSNYQVSKQADVMAIFYCLSEKEVKLLFDRLGYQYSSELLARTADYYLERNINDSSLSRVIHAGALALFDSEKSWEIYKETSQLDTHAAPGDTSQEGIHLGAMGATFDILQRRYMGLEATPHGLLVNPRTPRQLPKVSFKVTYRKCELNISGSREGCLVTADRNNYRSVPIIDGNSQSEFLLKPGDSMYFKCSHNRREHSE